MASIGLIRHVSLTVNCGFAPVAIRELTPCNKRCLQVPIFVQRIQICHPWWLLYLQMWKKSPEPVQSWLREILKGFATKWHPHNVRKEYEQHLSIYKWNALSAAAPSATVLPNYRYESNPKLTLCTAVSNYKFPPHHLVEWYESNLAQFKQNILKQQAVIRHELSTYEKDYYAKHQTLPTEGDCALFKRLITKRNFANKLLQSWGITLWT